MIINSNSKKSIATQTGNFSYLLEIACNTAGLVEFGFSGAHNKILAFTGISGQLKDFEGDFIYGYSTEEKVLISGNIGPSGHDYFINGLPINLGGPRNTGNAEWFYINPVNCSPNFDLKIVGEQPQMSFTNILYSGYNISGTGFVTNLSSSRIKIFSGISLDPDYRVDFPSGLFLNSVPFTGYKNNINISTVDDEVSVNYRLITNFGDLYATITNQTSFYPHQKLILQLSPYVISTGSAEGLISWENTLGADPLTSGINVSLAFQWSSGLSSGNFTGYWGLYTGLEDTSQLLGVNYYSGITGFSGQFESFGFGSRYLRLQKLLSGTDIGLLTINGYNTGLSLYITGGL